MILPRTGPDSRLEHAEIPLELLLVAERLETCCIIDLRDCGSL